MDATVFIGLPMLFGCYFVSPRLAKRAICFSVICHLMDIRAHDAWEPMELMSLYRITSIPVLPFDI